MSQQLDRRLIDPDYQRGTARLTARHVTHATNSYLPPVQALLDNNADAPFPLRLSLLDTSYRRREITLPVELS